MANPIKATQHRFNPLLCLRDAEWKGYFLECNTCKRTLAFSNDDGVRVFEPFRYIRDAIEAYANRNPPTHPSNSDMWQSVRDPIDTIRNEREAVARENDEREKRNEEMEIEDIPFDDMAYDCEDSAAGGLYLEDDTDEEGDDL